MHFPKKNYLNKSSFKIIYTHLSIDLSPNNNRIQFHQWIRESPKESKESDKISLCLLFNLSFHHRWTVLHDQLLYTLTI